MNATNLLRLFLCVAFLAVAGDGPLFSDDDVDDNGRGRGRGRPVLDYVVTIQNLSDGQPLSPPAAATHRRRVEMFRVGRAASAELEAIAEDGNQGPMVELLQGARRVTDVVDVGRPLTPSGSTVGDFTDAATFDITARPGDKLSLATMLICTNDGFTGIDRGRLPRHGSTIFLTNGYDAGTEENTEQSEDIVDPCSALGPATLEGDPNGNNNDGIETDDVIRRHPNIEEGGDLAPSDHGWADPVAKVTVTRVSETARRFVTFLSGAGEVPPVDTPARGLAIFALSRDESSLRYLLVANRIEEVTQAHIHMGSPDVNGPVVAFLFGLVEPEPGEQGVFARGTLTAEDVIGPLEGDFAALVDRLRSGRAYANVHTTANPAGEIRGQIGAFGGFRRRGRD